MRKLFPLVFVLVGIIIFLPAPLFGSSRYADILIHQALAKKLYNDRYWHVLLHYRAGIFGCKSLIDDPQFFLSPRGKTDPRDELIATIRAFFQEIPVKSSIKHPRCRFIARYTWLKEKLAIDERRMPPVTCDEETRVLQMLQPQSVALIFPSAHINSPASMFGHTLLVIEPSHKNRLISLAVNYSAVTQDTFGPSFAVKGLIGLYKGYFSMLPYYAKVQEYSDIDSRDMWEYSLNLTKEETVRMILHIFELNRIYSDYYFFDENCSYNILFLLEAARPSARLTDQYPFWVIPVDTIRDIKKNGLIDQGRYRPSTVSRIKHGLASLSANGKKLVYALLKGTMRPETVLAAEITREERIGVLDSVTELAQHRYASQKMNKDRYVDLFLSTLAARSRLGEAPAGAYEVMAPISPESSHRSSRISVGGGTSSGHSFQEITFRPAYHDLGDPPDGYGAGAQVVFGAAGIRYYDQKDKAQLQKLDIVDIISLAPRDQFFSPLSWKVHCGLGQDWLRDHREGLAFFANPGTGYSFNAGTLGMPFALLEADLRFASGYESNTAAGIGVTAGWLLHPGNRAIVRFQSSWYYYALGERFYSGTMLGGIRIPITRNLGVGFEAKKRYQFNYSVDEYALTLHYFF